MERRAVVTALALGVVVSLSVGAGAGLLLAPTPVPDVVAPKAGPSVVAVVPQPFTDERGVRATPKLAPAREYHATAIGVVRASQCVPGHEITSGSPVFTVDDRVIIALHLDAPPWRTLIAGMKGEDVADFQRELTRLGYAVADDGTYSAATATQAAKLWAAAGVSKTSTLPLDRIVWLPDGSATPATCALTVGATLTGTDTVFTTGGQLEALTLALAADAVPGARVASLDGGVTAALGPNGTIVDPVFLAAFAKTRGYLAWQADPTDPPTVTVRLAQPITVVAVPPAALYQEAGEQACLVDGGGGAVSVRIVGSQLGQTFVAASPALPADVTVPVPKDPPLCA